MRWRVWTLVLCHYFVFSKKIEAKPWKYEDQQWCDEGRYLRSEGGLTSWCHRNGHAPRFLVLEPGSAAGQATPLLLTSSIHRLFHIATSVPLLAKEKGSLRFCGHLHTYQFLSCSRCLCYYHRRKEYHLLANFGRRKKGTNSGGSCSTKCLYLGSTCKISKPFR